jgi:hypothetical protein
MSNYPPHVDNKIIKKTNKTKKNMNQIFEISFCPEETILSMLKDRKNYSTYQLLFFLEAVCMSPTAWVGEMSDRLLFCAVNFERYGFALNLYSRGAFPNRGVSSKDRSYRLFKCPHLDIKKRLVFFDMIRDVDVTSLNTMYAIMGNPINQGTTLGVFFRSKMFDKELFRYMSEFVVEPSMWEKKPKKGLKWKQKKQQQPCLHVEVIK